jgi:hypothetical protein
VGVDFRVQSWLWLVRRIIKIAKLRKPVPLICGFLEINTVENIKI